ncbi:MAG: DUF4374 domain-containing protein [Rikenellaceae bacterium]
MKKNYLFGALFLTAAVAVSSCKKDESVSTPVAKATSYVVAVSSTKSSATPVGADYLLSTDALGSEDLTIKGSGVESDLSSAQWYFYNDTRVFGLKYNDGDAVPAESYVMGEARPVYGMDYTSYRFTTYGQWSDYMVTSASNSYDSESTGVVEPYYKTEVYPRYMYIGKYHNSNGEFAGTAFESDNYLGTGEYCSLAGFAESNGYLYATVYPMGVTAYGSVQYETELEAASKTYYGDSSKYLDYVSSAYGGTNSGTFKPGEIPSTPFPNQFHIAVFKTEADFPKNPTIITDGRMSPPCGRSGSAQYPCIAADDDGDVYIFSPGNERKFNTTIFTSLAGTQLRNISSSSDATSDNYVDHQDLSKNKIGDGLYWYPAGSHSAKVMRIKKGKTALDESYGTDGVFDVETAMDGRSFLSVKFITGSGSKFLVQTYEPGVYYATDSTGSASTTSAYSYYVVDADAKSATKVTGIPAATEILAVSRNPFFENGKAYVGITTTANAEVEGGSAVYEIDAATGVATEKMKVTCYNILSIGKLSRY